MMLTREQILSMPAGPELDAACHAAAGLQGEPSAYSSSICHAWKLVVMMNYLVLKMSTDKLWTVRWSLDPEAHTCGSAPLAICRAFLISKST